jgi:hypothetical protein
MAGVFGNLWLLPLGYRMSSDLWPKLANGVWLATVVVLAFVALPAATRLTRIAEAAVAGNPPDGWESTLGRFRVANVALSVLYLGLLALMVFHWR